MGFFSLSVQVGASFLHVGLSYCAVRKWWYWTYCWKGISDRRSLNNLHCAYLHCFSQADPSEKWWKRQKEAIHILRVIRWLRYLLKSSKETKLYDKWIRVGNQIRDVLLGFAAKKNLLYISFWTIVYKLKRHHILFNIRWDKALGSISQSVRWPRIHSLSSH